MRKFVDLILKLIWGTFLVLTSFYALLAALPYTYYAFIKAAPYAWMPWFANHHALLFWAALFCVVFAYRQSLTSIPFLSCFVILAFLGVFLLLRPILPTLQDNARAYWTAVIALWPTVLTASLAIWKETSLAPESPESVSHFSYRTAALLAAGIAVVYAAATRVQLYISTRQGPQLGVKDAYFILWSVFSHFVVLVMVFSLLNLVRLAAARTAHPRVWRGVLSSLLLFAFLWILVARFLESAFSFQGWQVQLYAASLAAAVTALALSLLTPFLLGEGSVLLARNGKRVLLPAVISVFIVFFVLLVHASIGGSDWNGFLLGTLALVFWIVFGCCVYFMHQHRARYNFPVVVLVVLCCLLAYEGLQSTEFVWAKPLGKTDDEVQRSFDKYAARDVSFNLANNLLGNGRSEPCSEACRVMRTYTNVPHVKATFDLRLVPFLAPTHLSRPNIFLIVIDSLRPDYLGAYNSKVHFTPNLDAFAQDSIVIHNAYTPYAGTSLSEPAIWAGSLLLHAHYIQPFSRLNSLQTLARTDGYQIVISEDEILAALIPPASDIIRLDTDKHLWGELELGSTLDQLQAVIEARPANAPPIFFYSQPKNVHQFATNHLPTAVQDHWQAPPGFNFRISHEINQVDDRLGKFFSWLKERGLYDNSIIILTSDHGDATGEFGRISHSLVIYPEIMRVPLLVHLPPSMRKDVVFDDSRVSALIDITPSLYYLLGHRPIIANPLFGHPLFCYSSNELHLYHRDDLFFASDVRAAYGILAANGRYFYATYDSPAHSYLYDLSTNPNGEHDILTPALKGHYDQLVIEHLHAVGDFYGYRPGVRSLSAAQRPAN